MPNLNRCRINQYQHDLNQIKWVRYFSTNSMSFECVGESIVVQKFIESKLYYSTTSQHENDNRNSYTITCRKVDISLYCISVLNAFINAFERETNRINPISQGIIDLILFMYAKPIAIKIKYENITKHFLFCVASDEWDSIELKIIYEFDQLSKIKSLHYQHGDKKLIVSPDNCKSVLTSNVDKTFHVIPGILDELEPVDSYGIIDTIDERLAKYYRERQRQYYTGKYDIYRSYKLIQPSAGEVNFKFGIFKQFCNDNAFDNEDVEQELKETDADDCTLTDFDHQFPFDWDINDEDKNAEIFYILKYIAYVGYYPKQVAPKQVELSVSMCANITEEDMDHVVKTYSQMKCFAKYLRQDKNLRYFLAVSQKCQYPFLMYMVNSYSKDKAVHYKMTGKVISVHKWASDNKFVQKLKNKYPQIADNLQATIANYSKRIMKMLQFAPPIRIKDSLSEIIEYVAAVPMTITTMMNFMIDVNIAPFQLDLHIAVRAVTKHDTDVASSDDDKDEKDCIGDVHHHLTDFGVPYFNQKRIIKMQSARPIVRNFMDVWLKFKEELKTFNYNEHTSNDDEQNSDKDKTQNERKTEQEWKTHPQNTRFGIFVDRRNKDEKDQITFFQHPSQFNKIANNDVDEYGFELLQNCLIPRGTKENPNHITSNTNLRGELLTFMFNIKTRNEIRCYVIWNGQTMRINGENITNVLSCLFEENDILTMGLWDFDVTNIVHRINSHMRDVTYKGFCKALENFK
eukprot:45498_1